MAERARLAFALLLCGVVAACGGGAPKPQISAHGEGGPPDVPSSALGRGLYKVGDPYQINGVWYYPAEDFAYDETGIASWYGPGFHGEYTANGESYDMNELTAAHKTLPMPSFVRVTNLSNGRSVVVRVNDRGPFVAGRIIDLSRRAAQLLAIDGPGTARVRVTILAEESRQIATAMREAGRVQLARSTRVAPAVPSTKIVAVAPSPSPALTASPVARIETTRLPAPSPPSGTAPILQEVSLPLPDPTGPAPSVTPKRTRIFVQAGAFSNADNARRLGERLQRFGQTVVTPVNVGGQQLFRVRIGPLDSVEAGDRVLDRIIGDGQAEARLIVD